MYVTKNDKKVTRFLIVYNLFILSFAFFDLIQQTGKTIKFLSDTIIMKVLVLKAC